MTEHDPVLHLHEPGDLIEAVPYLLGFHPSQSLVIVGLDQSRVGVTLRIDLVDAAERAAIQELIEVLSRSAVSSLVVLIYRDADPDPHADQLAPAPSSVMAEGMLAGPLPEQQLALGLEAEFWAAGLTMLDALLVSGGMWWSYLGRAVGCEFCSTGRPLAGDSSPAAAAAIFAGMIAHADRAALAAVLEPDDDSVRARHLPGIHAREDASLQATLDGRALREQRSLKRAVFAAARDADRTLFMPRSAAVTDQLLCRHAVALSDISIRDSLWLAIDQGRLDGRGFWQALLRQLPAPYDAAPLFLFGWAAWREGNGSLAVMAAERALTSAPGYTAAELLYNAVRHGLDPFRTPRLRSPRAGLPRSA